jgi:hypothetical protein
MSATFTGAGRRVERLRISSGSLTAPSTGGLTCDRSIASKPHELEALKASGLVIFFLTPGIHHLGPLEQMLHLLRVWADVLEATRSAKAGQRWFKIKQGGKLEHFGE